MLIDFAPAIEYNFEASHSMKTVGLWNALRKRRAAFLEQFHSLSSEFQYAMYALGNPPPRIERIERIESDFRPRRGRFNQGRCYAKSPARA